MQFVICPKSFYFLTCGRHFAECLLFESKIRFDITMRCLSALVTEPQCYHSDVNSRLEKMHSTRAGDSGGSGRYLGWLPFRAESRIPAPEGVLPFFVEHSGSYLQ